MTISRAALRTEAGPGGTRRVAAGRGRAKHFLPLLFSALPLAAADLVTFTTGAQMTALRAECPAGSAVCVLHLEGGRVELPARAVACIERLPEPEPPPGPPPAVRRAETQRQRDVRQLVTEAACATACRPNSSMPLHGPSPATGRTPSRPKARSASCS